ncbi:hypothetical protein [Methyloprofundus sedimenti]|uniref:hypothetical protein n=1 Tax=Methyloprofundus sedimenti TaxID=1420851 RepID=UPI00117C5D78|nr:hypothetical protein [Methyloprofundus sedimenti]
MEKNYHALKCKGFLAKYNGAYSRTNRRTGAHCQGHLHNLSLDPLVDYFDALLKCFIMECNETASISVFW